MGSVVHFEVFGHDAEELARFAERAFGWRTTNWGEDPSYLLVSTGAGGGIDGAFAPEGTAGEQRIVLTMETDDLDGDLRRVEEAGGVVVVPKAPIPGIGQHAYVAAPDGVTVFGLLQPEPDAGAGMAGEPDSREAWAEVGERLREFGATLGQAVSGTASPQAQRLREQAERAAVSIGEASKQAADRAKPHVASALEGVSGALGDLAARLRQERAEGLGNEPGPENPPPRPGAEARATVTGEGGDVEGPLGEGAVAEETEGDVGGEGEPSGDPTRNTARMDDERMPMPPVPEKPLVDGREQE